LKCLEFILIFPEISGNVQKFAPNVKFTLMENLQPYTLYTGALHQMTVNDSGVNTAAKSYTQLH